MQLTQQNATRLSELTEMVLSNLATATVGALRAGECLCQIRDDILTEGSEFKAYVESELGIAPSYAYRMIKAWNTYGSHMDVASQVSAGVLHELMTSDDPQARLREALEAQKEKGSKITTAEARQLAKQAKAVIDEGEQAEYLPASTTTEELVSLMEEEITTSLSTNGETQGASLSTPKNTVRAKRTLNTLFDLLVLELSNAQVTTVDLRDAVLEMLLSSDPSEVETATQLREFCTIVATAAN